MAAKPEEVKRLKALKPENTKEEDWQGRGDAYTLAQANMIRGDKARFQRAQNWAAALVEQEADEAKAFKAVSEE